ncbi:MAG: class I tRNA ligase family protein, partial [Patescibacteria group bacterium]
MNKTEQGLPSLTNINPITPAPHVPNKSVGLLFFLYFYDIIGHMTAVNEKLLKPYDPKTTEEKIYKLWEESGFFNPDICIEKGVTKEDAKHFSIVLPPPNVTGNLHTGHALMLVIQDIMVRYARMKGLKTLWVPGTDHAAIATQSKVEKLLEKEGVRKNDLGREEFLKRVEKFAQESHDTIVNQAKKMGASLDWSREAFTLDEKRNLAVKTAFKTMYDDGLIYRGHRIVNWDPKGQTVISDDETIYEEKKGKFYTFKYGPFEIGTARPETKFGDKYVVMHPNDKRYDKWKHGDKLTMEWINGPIEATVIKDEMIDMEFGTGVMTITPWHSHEDFLLAEKYKLDKEQIIDKHGKLLPIAGVFAGMKISEARDKIVDKLKEKGLLVSIDENYVNRVATAERTGGMIEPQIMLQWFIDVNKKIASHGNKSLKELMLEPVREGKIKIMPVHFEKVYYNWIENLRDWCISRQIWYGHRIPVWYKGDEIFVGLEAPDGDDWTQDEDTLDTWFSSGLWTFSTLGWPNKTKDLETYHPTSVLDTGHDLI